MHRPTHTAIPRRRRRWLRGAPALGIAAVLAAPAPSAQIALPDMGSSSRSVISAAEEQQLGEAFMRELRSQVRIIDNPQIEQYVKSLGYKLTEQSDDPSRRFTFFVVDEPVINAFAGPGGFIGINSGLITATESEGELAAVMAHEIAHVTQGHIGRSIELQDKMTLPALAGLAAAILIGSQNPEAGQAAAMGVMAGQAQMQLNFSRQNEEEADRVGMQMLAAAGFDPRAMPAFFEKLQQESRYYSQPPEFLSTHPVTVSRIADTRARAEKYEYRQYPESLSYHLVRARLRVMDADNPRQAVDRFEEGLRSGQYRNEQATHYGLALALEETGQTGRARSELAPLLDADPDRIEYRALAADIELEAGNLQKALDLYADAQKLYPDNELLTRGYAEALLRAGRAQQALRVLEEYRKYQGLDASMYRLLAQAYDQAGREVESRAALAEHYYRLGQLEAAIKQLHLAMQAPESDFYQSSRIEARLKQFEEEQQRREQN